MLQRFVCTSNKDHVVVVIMFNEHVTNVHACSERGQMIRCSNVTEIWPTTQKTHTEHTKNDFKNDNTTKVSNTGKKNVE